MSAKEEHDVTCVHCQASFEAHLSGRLGSRIAFTYSAGVLGMLGRVNGVVLVAMGKPVLVACVDCVESMIRNAEKLQVEKAKKGASS